MATDVTICRARLLPAFSDPVGSELTDVTVRGGSIVSVTPHTTMVPGAIDADGAVLMPGLWDAHVHFSTHSLLEQCLQLRGEAEMAEIAHVLGNTLSSRPDDGLLVGFGFRGATWPVEPRAAFLDAISDEPIALISGDLHSLWCNTAGLAAVGAAHHPTGLLREEEAFDAIIHLMRTEVAHVDALVRAAQSRAAAIGVVGMVDMEMHGGIDTWQRRLACAPSLQRVEIASYPDELERLIDAGLHTGDRLGKRLRVGPLKIISDGSLNSRTAHCLAPYPHPIEGSPYGVANYSKQEVGALLRRATENQIRAAVHAIGDLACRDALDAFEETGARGTIEHAQLVHPTDLVRFAQLGIGASVQPAQLLDDEKLLEEVWPKSSDHAFSWRALIDAGAQLRFGSDAPVAALDPWLGMEVAVHKPHLPSCELTPNEALAASTRSRVAAGQPADLLLVQHSPEQLSQGDFTSQECLLTLVAGEATHVAFDMIRG